MKKKGGDEMSLRLEVPQEFYEALRVELKEVYAAALSEAKRDAGILKEYLSIKEACELVGCSRNTFQNNFLDEGLPLYKIAQKTYVKKTELNQFISRHQVN